VDHNGAVGEMDVVECVDHPLPFDGGGGADSLEDVLMVEELRRQMDSRFCEVLALCHILCKTIILPVFDHHDYRFEKQYLGTLSLKLPRAPRAVLRNTNRLFQNGRPTPVMDKYSAISFFVNDNVSVVVKKNLNVDVLLEITIKNS